MSSGWMKLEHATPDKPEIFAMAQELGMDPDAVVGKCIRVWSWYDIHTENGNAPVTVAALLNRLTGCDGFVAAMQKVGWIRIENECIALCNFDRHTGETAKTRSLNAKRQADHRARNAKAVTNTVTREDKRRKEKETHLCDESHRFDEWWEAYGKKVNRKKCAAKWAKLDWKKLGVTPDDLLADARSRHERSRKWRDGFQPDPLTYLNGERWHDELDKPVEVAPNDFDGVRALSEQHPEVDIGGLHWKQARKVLADRLGMRT